MFNPDSSPRYLRESVVCAVLALLYTAPFLLALDKWGVHDWELFTAMAEVPRQLILAFGQFPFWNPYISGGNILFHHPEVGVISPFTAITLLFGAVAGLKIQVLVCYFLGFWGSVRLARQGGMSEAAGYLFASVYFGGSYFALHFAEGHIPFTQFCYLPWIFYFWLGSLERTRRILGAAIFLALMILGNGAAAPFLLTVTALGILATCTALQRKSWRPLALSASGTLLGVGLAGVKFLPMYFYFQQNPWLGSVSDTTPLAALPSIFLDASQGLYDHRDGLLQMGWHEYGAYIFPLVILLALWRAIRLPRQSWPWIALALLFLLVGLGNFDPLAPWTLLHNLPGWESSRAPGRAFQFTVMGLAYLGALGFDDLRQKLLSARAPIHKATYVGVVVIFLTALVNFYMARQSLSQSFVREPRGASWQEEFRQEVGDISFVYGAVRENRGVLRAPKLSGYIEGRGLLAENELVLPEYFLLGSAEVTRRDYRGNEINYTLADARSGEVVLGMGFDPGWEVVEPPGAELRSEQGLLAVTFSDNDPEVRLRYRPPYLWSGILVSVLSVVVFVILWRRFRVLSRRRGQRPPVT